METFSSHPGHGNAMETAESFPGINHSRSASDQSLTPLYEQHGDLNPMRVDVDLPTVTRALGAPSK